MYRKHGLAYVFTRDFWLYSQTCLKRPLTGPKVTGRLSRCPFDRKPAYNDHWLFLVKMAVLNRFLKNHRFYFITTTKLYFVTNVEHNRMYNTAQPLRLC